MFKNLFIYNKALETGKETLSVDLDISKTSRNVV